MTLDIRGSSGSSGSGSGSGSSGSSGSGWGSGFGSGSFSDSGSGFGFSGSGLGSGLTVDNMIVWRTIILQAVSQDDLSILLLLDDFPQRTLLLRILPILPLILHQIRPQMILFVS